MDKIKYIKFEESQGQYSNSIPIGADAKNIQLENGNNFEDILGDYDYFDKGSVEQRFNNLDNDLNNIKIDITNFEDSIEDDIIDLKGNGDLMYILAPYKGIDEQGDCTLIHCKDENILIDIAGSTAQFRKIEETLQKYGFTKITRFIASHYHGDHVGNFERLLNSSILDTNDCIFYLPATPDYSKCHDTTDPSFEGLTISGYRQREAAIKNAILNHALEYVVPQNNEIIYFGKISCRFLNMDPSKWEESYTLDLNSTTINSWSIINEFTYGNIKFLTTGDSNVYNLDSMAEYITVSPDIYKAEHHGANGDSLKSDLWCKIIAPKYSIIQGNVQNIRYQTYKNIYKSGIVYRQSFSKDDTLICTDGYRIRPIYGMIDEKFEDTLPTSGEMIPEGSDLNDYTTAGSYYIATTSAYQTIQNAPEKTTPSPASLKVIETWSSSRPLQILIKKDKIFHRQFTANGWTEWVTQASSRGEVIPEGSDLNNYTTTGSYYIANQISYLTIQNVPKVRDGGAASLKVIETWDSSRPLQILIKANGIFYRQFTENGWTEWTTQFSKTGIMIPEGSDLNDYTSAGSYCIINTTSYQTIQNTPNTPASAASLKVIETWSNSRPLQILIKANGIFYRLKTSNTTFSDWTPLNDYPITISERSDLNNFKTPGKYGVNEYDIVETLLNLPFTPNEDDEYAMLLENTSYYSSNRILQKITTIPAMNIYTRFWNNKTWSNWKQQ